MKYTAVTHLKTAMFLAGLAIMAAIVWFSFQLVGEMRDTTRQTLAITVERYRDLLIADNPELALKTIQQIEFPIILADEKGEPLFWKNLTIASDNHSPMAIRKLKESIRKFDHAGNQPVALDLGTGIVHYFHYADERMIGLFQRMTILGTGAVLILLLIGYYGFSSVRAAESRAMWIGLARETAHQFGTPVSSLMAWLELLQSRYPNETAFTEMERDILRVRGVLARFSAIGRSEKLTTVNLDRTVKDAIAYIEQRFPKQNRTIMVTLYSQETVPVRMQPELIGWVLENLLRNAAEAIDRTNGKIEVTVKTENSWGVVEVADNGKGMTKSERRNAFRAGYTTKQKGWGVGLSLAKRIVEEEHNGTLEIVATAPKMGTTFRLKLPLSRTSESSAAVI